MISLIDMAKVPMKTILEKLGYVEIQCLRKTCHSLRNFIDYFKPDQSIDVMEISGTAGKISLLIYRNDDSQLYPNGQKIHVEYQALDGENTEITWFRKNKYPKKTILNENFSELLSRDFGLILKCKLPILRRFSIDFKYTSKQFLEKHLLNKSPIKTNTLIIKTNTLLTQRQDDILSFLPYICADTLKKLEIEFVDLSGTPMNISKIVEHEHWKKAKELHIHGVSVMAGIQNFEHFSYLVVKFDLLYLKDVLYLKELFLYTPSTSKQYRINFRQLSDRDAFIQDFGHPITEQRETLIFERPDDKGHVVTIGFFPKFFEFKIAPVLQF
ncbi:unnamed protein product [Caenorhabditis brenneri]